MTIASRIRDRGLTLTEFAKSFGVSTATVSRWAKGATVPAERVGALADALDLPRSTIRPDLWPEEPAARHQVPTPAQEPAQ